MVTAFLLVIIYIAFISLGLPDSVIGVTIPALQKEFGISPALGGFLSMFIVGGTVISSFISSNIIKRFGTGKVVFISCLMTGSTLLGFSVAPSFYWLILLAIPLGFGGGTVDVALNSYVAHHFKAFHMNWLHSFWGVGATLGPIIIASSLKNSSWRSGFSNISYIQLTFAVILLISLPIWKKHKKTVTNDKQTIKDGTKKIFSIPGIPYALLTMVLYCAAEIGTGLWGSTYLIGVKSFSPPLAAQYIALYYGGITLGRFLSGFVSLKIDNKGMIRLGAVLSLIGIFIILLPLSKLVVGIGIIVAGLGFAPIFPAMIHEVPKRFGKENGSKIIGYQMGFAYMGSAIIPPIMGVIYQSWSLKIFPISIIVIVLFLVLVTERLNSVCKED